MDRRPLIERVALEWPALASKNGTFQYFRFHFLPVAGPCGAPIHIVSTGPERKENIILKYPFD